MLQFSQDQLDQMTTSAIATFRQEMFEKLRSASDEDLVFFSDDDLLSQIDFCISECGRFGIDHTLDIERFTALFFSLGDVYEDFLDMDDVLPMLRDPHLTGTEKLDVIEAFFDAEAQEAA